MKPALCVTGAILAAAASVQAATRLDVTVIDRQDHGGNYTYVVPGFSTSTGTATGNCTGTGATVNCTGVAASTTSTTPGFVGSYQVRGATLSLELPDGRIAVVNCDSKTNWTDWSTMQAYRSCRIPLTAKIEAEFSGDKAKLRWPVSIDGSKFESETCQILGVLDRP